MFENVARVLWLLRDVMRSGTLCEIRYVRNKHYYYLKPLRSLTPQDPLKGLEHEEVLVGDVHM